MDMLLGSSGSSFDQLQYIDFLSSSSMSPPSPPPTAPATRTTIKKESPYSEESEQGEGGGGGRGRRGDEEKDNSQEEHKEYSPGRDSNVPSPTIHHQIAAWRRGVNEDFSGYDEAAGVGFPGSMEELNEDQPKNSFSFSENLPEDPVYDMPSSHTHYRTDFDELAHGIDYDNDYYSGATRSPLRPFATTPGEKSGIEYGGSFNIPSNLTYGVSHYRFPPSRYYIFSFGNTIYQDATLKLPAAEQDTTRAWRNDEKEMDRDEMDRKPAAKRPGEANFPVQQSSAFRSFPSVPQYPSHASLPPGSHSSYFQPRLMPWTSSGRGRAPYTPREVPRRPVGIAHGPATMHHANNPPSPLIPQRRSSRRLQAQQAPAENPPRNDRPVDSAGIRPSDEDSDGHELPNLNDMHPFRPSPQELDAESNDRARNAVISWYTRLNEYWEFRRIHKHGNVPQKYGENKQLGIWVNKQRMEMKAHQEGRENKLTPWKIEKLKEARFVWAKPKGQASWENQYRALLAYKSKFGDCDVPTKYKGNKALGRWVSTQRSNYKKFMNGEEISVDKDEMRRRIEKLQDIGFSWSRLPSPTGSSSTSSHFA